jgi:hypothetical protein
MNLSDLINLDQQLAAAEEDPGNFGRLEEDRRISRELQAGPSPRNHGEDEKLLRGWSKSVSGLSAANVGGFYAGSVRWTAFLLVAAGLLAGVGTASALLRYDGSQPINVLIFLGAIVGSQLLLLPLLIVSLVFRRRCRSGAGIAVGLVIGLLHWVFGQLARSGAPAGQVTKIKHGLETLQTPRSILTRIQPILVGTLIQFFGVAFNLAAVATLTFFVVFSDLSFSWGTTIEAEPKRIHQITAGLSLPWASFLPQARPSLELVEATRFARIEGTFVGSGSSSVSHAGGWWRFLAAATMTYGFLPRVTALGIGIFLLRRETARALVRSEQVKALRERLLTPRVTVGQDVPVSALTRDRLGGDKASKRVRPMEPGLKMMPIFWAYDEAPPWDAVVRVLQIGLRATAVDPLRAGQIEMEEETVLYQVKRAIELGVVSGVAVFFEPFEPPKTDARRFLARLRKAMGPSSPIVVFLAQFEGKILQTLEVRDWKAWEMAVQSGNDPFLVMQKPQFAVP